MASRDNSRAIAAFVAGAVALGGAGVAAADALPVTAGHDFYISGSTAMDNPLRSLFTDTGTTALCQDESGSGFIDVYTDATKNDSTSGHQFVVVCKLRGAIGSITAGTVVAVGKESNGGSLEGIKPVAEGTALTFINPLVAPACGTVTAAGGGLPAFPAPTQAYTHHFNCPVVASLVAPQIGVADENPEVFNIGTTVVTAADSAALNKTQLAQMPFGIALSLNAYRALQRMEGLTATSDTIPNMPTLSSQVIKAIYQGTLTSWAGVTNAAGTAINNATFLGGEPAVSSTIFLCRRGTSSGTNSAVDIHFLGQRCTTGSNPMTLATTSNANCSGLNGSPNQNGCKWSRTNNIGDLVFAGAGGGDVAKCLNDHDRIDQFAIGNLTTNQAFGDAGGTGGSGDADSATSTNTHFRFVRIDGMSPDNGSVVNGSYDWVQDNIITDKIGAPANVAALRTALINDFVVSFAVLASNMTSQVGGDTNWTAGPMLDQLQPTVLSSGSPAPNTQPTYVTGAAVKSGAGGVTPVTPYTYLLQNSTNPQNCAPPAYVPNTGFKAFPSP